MRSQFLEQSRLMLRVMPYVAQESCFALKGGTAINFYLRDMPRLSVDIDLTYLPIKERNESLSEIAAALERIKASIERGVPSSSIQVSLYEGRTSKLFISTPDAKIKIEPNRGIRGSLNPTVERDLCPTASERFEVAVRMRTLSEGDIYGGKLCAALDRQHPRDLFDVKLLLEDQGITSEIRKSFLVHLISHNRPINELIEPNRKDITTEFTSDFEGMLAETVTLEALVEVREKLIAEIQSKLTLDEKRFLVSLKKGEPEWSLLGIEKVEELPAVRWKLQNIRKMDNAKREEQLGRDCGPAR